MRTTTIQPTTPTSYDNLGDNLVLEVETSLSFTCAVFHNTTGILIFWHTAGSPEAENLIDSNIHTSFEQT